MSVVLDQQHKQCSVSHTQSATRLSALCQRAKAVDKLAGMGTHTAGKEEVGIKLMLLQVGRPNGNYTKLKI